MAFTTAIATVAGTVMSVVSSIGQAQYAKDAAKTEATNTEISYALNAAQQQRQLQQTIGKQQALYGAMGVDTSSGSPFALGSDTASTAAEDLYGKRFSATASESAAIGKGDQQAAGQYAGAIKSVFDFGSKNVGTAQNLYDTWAAPNGRDAAGNPFSAGGYDAASAPYA